MDVTRRRGRQKCRLRMPNELLLLLQETEEPAKDPIQGVDTREGKKGDGDVVIPEKAGPSKENGRRSKAFLKGKIRVVETAEVSRGVFKCSHGAVGQEVEECKILKKIHYECGHKLYRECWECTRQSHLLNQCYLVCFKYFDECGHHRIARVRQLDENGVPIKPLCDSPCNRTMCPRGNHAVFHDKSHPCSIPCPPCLQTVKYELPCGHSALLKCYQGSPLNDPEFKCKRKCLRRHAKCKHECKKKCFEECGLCTEYVFWVPPGCIIEDHSDLGLCSVIRRLQDSSSSPTLLQSLARIKYRSEEQIGQFLARKNAFFTATEISTMICEMKCYAILDCGHPCSGTCGKCSGGMMHTRCRQKCDKLLICGHDCKETCGSGCPPCKLPCTRSCDHHKDPGPSKNNCDMPCGAPCNWNCDKPCSYACPHGKCTLQCDQICNKEICFEFCEKVLTCGHPCVGFCGEMCPPICRICNKEKLSAGCFLTLGEVPEDARFIYLEGCGHCMESESLELFINAEPDNNEIVRIRCPLCREPLRWIRRFSETFHRNWKAVNEVKERCWGDQTEIEESLTGNMELLEQFNIKTYINFIDPAFIVTIGDLLDPGRRSQITIQIADTLKWRIRELGEACSQITKLIDLPVYHPMDAEAYQYVIDQWHDLISLLIQFPSFPVQPYEMKSYEAAKQFVILRTKFCDILPEKLRAPQVQYDIFMDLISSAKGTELFFRAKRFLKVTGRFSTEEQETATQHVRAFLGHINSSVALPEEERRQVVAAFPGGPGRWFKCQNGHVYVITECGGAMFRSVCPECNETIGGGRHRLAEDNFVAQEMDGADIGMYDQLVQLNLQLHHDQGGQN